MSVPLHTDDPIKLGAFATRPVTSLWFWSMVLPHLSPRQYLGVPKSSPWDLSQRPSKIQLGIVMDFSLATHGSSGERIQTY